MRRMKKGERQRYKDITIAKWKIPRRVFFLLLLIELIGAGIAVYDYVTGELRFDGIIERAPYGKGDTEEELRVVGDGEEETVTVHISEQVLSEKEALQKIERAKEEIDATVIGKNKSFEEVSADLDVREHYADGYVTASWSFDHPQVIQTDGSVSLEALEEETLVQAEVKLSCSGYEERYVFPIQVIIPKETTKDGFLYYLSRTLTKVDESDREKETWQLPRTVAGRKVSWKRLKNFRGPQIMLMGLFTGVAVFFGKREEVRRAAKRRQQLLEQDYPEIIGALSLYVSAGISTKQAMERIAREYDTSNRRRGSPHPGYDAVLECVRRMNDGMGERGAYQKLAKRCDHRMYSKLAMLLSQNVRSGNRKLKKQLEKEEAACFEARKVRARILGEEASTKLLLPMGMMLGVVLILTIAPALLQMKI